LEIGAAGSVGDDRLFGLVFDVVFQGCVYRSTDVLTAAIIFFRDLLSTLVIDGVRGSSPSFFLLVSDLTGCYEVVLDLHEQFFVGKIRGIEASCT
jgi:hypothetical protein